MTALHIRCLLLTLQQRCGVERLSRYRSSAVPLPRLGGALANPGRGLQHFKTRLITSRMGTRSAGDYTARGPAPGSW